ncbi:OLC1v1014556C1 [Oldenlandia corymbosa var. corymbosa]|uniref:ABC-type xenobiotic transporter n=1 Tax=Oldenlandia corymbosa var. corymbosa TaxID=529605 RepID=A0AAV1E111_OLDCO|nr:OLC1v1014556C1 [Oldenlandia corymbosa var. corymbosa]
MKELKDCIFGKFLMDSALKTSHFVAPVITVLGFGANLVTLAFMITIGVTKRGINDNTRKCLPVRVLSYVVPALGAFMSCLCMVLMLRESLDGYSASNHQWLFSGSRFAVWVAILLASTCDCWVVVYGNCILCLWWILKPFLLIPHLLTVLSSPEVFRYVSEVFLALLEIMFGILINITRMNWASYNKDSNSMEEPLLPCTSNTKECQTRPGLLLKIWHLFTFNFIDSVLESGVKRQLDSNDLLELPEDLEPLSCYYLMRQSWEEQQSADSASISLIKAICGVYGWPYFRLGLLKVINDCLGFVGPVLLNKLIRFLQQGTGHYEGYIFAVFLGLASILKSFLDTQYSFHLGKLKLKLRASIMSVIYHKCLYVRLAERSKFSEGEIQTFMSVDADRTVNLCNSFHDMWSLPLQIGVALYLLYTQVKFAFLSGIAITVLLIPVNKWIAELIAKATKNMMEQKDERIRRTAELLTYIRTLKMYSWEILFAGWLMKTRSLEVKYLSTRKYLDAWCVFFWATTPTLFSLSTFGLYTLMGHQLDAATVFTCLALFNNLISPLNSFPWVINGLIDAFISSGRLSKFLSSSEYKLELEKRGNILANDQCDSENIAVIISDASSTWSSSAEKEFSLVLENLNLRFPSGFLVAVIGEVGSGKSSLLNLILGEMRLVNGTKYLSGSTTYVPQIPWILSGTIRDNILFGRDYDLTRYSDVLKACALDLDVSMMVGGDMACIGEKGINLSGGQKARLALARALYCGSDIYMLDDVLSAVDAHVAFSILHNAILGPLMNRQTRILCTHNVQAIYAADMVVELDKGTVKWVGSPSELSLSSYLAVPSIDNCNVTSVVQVEQMSSAITEVQEEVQEDDSVCNLGDLKGSIEAEKRKEGRVELMVYKKYAEFAGRFIAILTCVSAILMQFSRNGNDLWLSYWVDTTGSRHKHYSTAFYLLLNRLINANVSFFDQTPTGRILNRFSSDLYTIDDALPFILNILLANFVGLLGIAIVLSYVQVTFLLLLLPFWYIYSKLQFYYRSTSRELRRLDSVSRSPIYASFTETLDGASTIRAFKSEDFFFCRFTQHVRLYQRASYSEVTASLWLSLRLQLLAAFIVSFVAVMAVIGSHRHLPIDLGTPGLVGLALSYAAPIVSLLGSFLTSLTETEKEMVSVERVLQYMDIPQETVGNKQLILNWPSQGEIRFQNVTLRYMPSLPPALRGVSFEISGGTQVGVIGRTGAGKSSILNALFRLNPICEGCIIVDGIDIAGISLRDLRSHMAVVPQSPFLFEGSLRSNLDPLQMNDDTKIWNILEKCHMKQEVVATGGLAIHVRESGVSFSVGQRQLLCLARALLKSSQVFCLDECTANVDTQTASKLQDVISSECRGITVITIAHRISTVLNMDNILILDQGALVEQGNPRVLLQDESSLFSSFAKASNM